MAPAPRATPGFPDATPPRSPFALPPEPSPGVLGAPTGPAPGVGGPAEGVPAARSSVEPGAAERLAGAGRGGTINGAGFLPLGGMPISSTDQEHRRPDYLVEDADAFADDRWFTPAVLGADDTDGC